MSTDIIRFYCQDSPAQHFHGEACRFYLTLSTECRLLKECALREIFEKGRCQPSDMVAKAVSVNLYEYSDRIQPDEYLSSLHFEIMERMKQTRLRNGFTLYVLKGYINITAYRNVRDALEKDGVLTRRVCGHCVYLSPAKPHRCLRETAPTDQSERDHPQRYQIRRPSDRACQHGFDAFTVEDGEWREPVDASLAANRILIGAKFLQDRANAADGDLRKRYERQYLVFCKLIHWLGNAGSWDQEKPRLAHELAVSLKTLDRDLQEILSVFEQHDVL